MKLLLVEDEPKTVAYLSKGFRENGFVVDAATDGEEGLHLARTAAYDLVILDVMLPCRDGWSIVSALHNDGGAPDRAAGAGKGVRPDLPILILTARDSVEDRVKGLNLGADDYLVKPFAFSELLARVQSLLRRAPMRRADRLQVSDLDIDLVGHKASRAGVRLHLTAKEFLLLSLLARRSGEALSRTVIAEQVWDMNFDSDTNVVDVHVRRLRSKVDDPFPRKLIHTLRGVGYVLEERD
jgi:two-component system copper resistance phosphate regulon response regulator CusR